VPEASKRQAITAWICVGALLALALTLRLVYVFQVKDTSLVLPEELDRWMACAQDARRAWLAQLVPMAERRPMLLQALNDCTSGRRPRAASREPRAADTNCSYDRSLLSGMVSCLS
jgi:hypothetical protein